MRSKVTLWLFFALSAVWMPAQARAVAPWSDDELMKGADLVVVGRPVEVRDLDETNSLGFGSTALFQSRFRGVETTFKVSNVLKGMPVNDRIVLHHYREVLEWGSPPNAPTFMSFAPGGTNEYLLYLKQDGTNRYAPVAGQIDTWLAIKPATNLVHPGFPLLAALVDADPSVRHLVSMRVPTKLKIQRTADTLSVEIDTNSFETTNLMVGSNMVTGVQSEEYVYPEGEARPANGGVGLGGLDFNLGVRYRHLKPDNIPLPGKNYVVEIELAVFETDIPPQHMWDPAGSKNYKVLWRRTLRQVVQ